MPSDYLLVDGHSVIFAWPELRAQHVRRMAAAREALIKDADRLTRTRAACRVVVVFDGQGARASEESEPGGIQVFYAAAGQTADAVIERLVAKYAASCRLVVATSDGLEQQTAHQPSARPVACRRRDCATCSPPPRAISTGVPATYRRQQMIAASTHSLRRENR